MKYEYKLREFSVCPVDDEIIVFMLYNSIQHHHLQRQRNPIIVHSYLSETDTIRKISVYNCNFKTRTIEIKSSCWYIVTKIVHAHSNSPLTSEYKFSVVKNLMFSPLMINNSCMFNNHDVLLINQIEWGQTKEAFR